MREVHELMWILKGLKVQVPKGVDKKLKVIVGGRDFAALDSDSNSRNIQFELRIASYFCQAGCEVDISSDTDVIAFSNDQEFYLECKRVGSDSQLRKRISEARKQLSRRMPKKHSRRDIYGCIAVDVTKVAFPHNGLTWAVSNDHSRDIVQEKLISIAENSRRLQLFGDCRNLFSYWFQIHIPSLILNPPTPITRFSSYHIFRELESRKQRRATRAFCVVFESSSRGDIRETSAEPLTPKKMFTIPKGAEFYFDEELLHEFIADGAIRNREMNEEIATLDIDGREHRFTFLDFRMVAPQFTEESRDAMKADPVRARLELVASMYVQRFPYEQSENHPIRQ